MVGMLRLIRTLQRKRYMENVGNGNPAQSHSSSDRSWLCWAGVLNEAWWWPAISGSKDPTSSQG
jgi:hypothetical protein